MSAYSPIPTWSETVAVSAGVATRSADPTNPAGPGILPTDGFPLGGLRGVRILLQAASGQTISGAGNIRIWYYDPVLAFWFRSPALDIAVTMPTAKRGWCSYDLDVSQLAQGGSYMLPFLDSVGVSGGANVIATARFAKDGRLQ